MYDEYGTVSGACRNVADLCTVCIFYFCYNLFFCVCVWQCRCLLLWRSCKTKQKGEGWAVCVAATPFFVPWSCMCSAMHIDLCALNWYGCLLVASDVSVLGDATTQSGVEPAHRTSHADVQSLSFSIATFMPLEKCIMLLSNIKLSCSFNYVMTIYRLCI